MSSHRFENIESQYLAPHLSTGKAPVIDGMSPEEAGQARLDVKPN